MGNFGRFLEEKIKGTIFRVQKNLIGNISASEAGLKIVLIQAFMILPAGSIIRLPGM
jgi:hypothetical protein